MSSHSSDYLSTAVWRLTRPFLFANSRFRSAHSTSFKLMQPEMVLSDVLVLSCHRSVIGQYFGRPPRHPPQTDKHLRLGMQCGERSCCMCGLALSQKSSKKIPSVAVQKSGTGWCRKSEAKTTEVVRRVAGEQDKLQPWCLHTNVPLRIPSSSSGICPH